MLLIDEKAGSSIVAPFGATIVLIVDEASGANGTSMLFTQRTFEASETPVLVVSPREVTTKGAAKRSDGLPASGS